MKGFRCPLAAVAAALVLVACARPTLPDLSSLPQRPESFPPASFTERAARGGEVLRIAAGESWLHIRVGKAGRLARFGHNHILATQSIHGFVTRSGDRLWAVAYVPVESLEVDPPVLRRAAGAGYESEVGDEDREGTRANLLGEAVLDAARYPFLFAELTVDPTPVAEFTVRDQRLTVPLDLELTGSGPVLTAAGRFTLDHAALGLEPFSTLGGALRVAERIEVSFRIQARPSPR